MKMSKYISNMKEERDRLNILIYTAEKFSGKYGYDHDAQSYIVEHAAQYYPNSKTIFENAWELFGDLQYLVVIEELSELQQEISKLWRKGPTIERLEKTAEEIADVQIMIEQLKTRHSDLENLVPEKYAAKLTRLRDRLQNGYYAEEVKKVSR